MCQAAKSKITASLAAPFDSLTSIAAGFSYWYSGYHEILGLPSGFVTLRCRGRIHHFRTSRVPGGLRWVCLRNHGSWRGGVELLGRFSGGAIHLQQAGNSEFW